MLRPLLRLAALACLLAAGCTTYAPHAEKVRSAYFAGDLEGARAAAESAGGDPRYADVLDLEGATLLLCEGRVGESERLLRQVRDRFDHLEQADAGEQALSLLTDDQRLAYSGEDYEKVLVRAFLALANLLGEGDDAGAYALQVAQKQQEIIKAGTGPDGKNPKEDYKQVAVGAYLYAALREETHQNYDDAARSLEQVCHWAPEFAPGKQDLQRARAGRHSARGNGVVYVFALVGRGPYKEEAFEVPTTAALLVADRILSATAEHTLPPTVAPVKVPRVVVPANAVQGVRVRVDGQARGQTETLTDVGRMAVEQAEALRATVIGRAVARRVVKKAAVYGAKEVLEPAKGGAASIALDVAGVVWEATESADTRCWGLLPEKIQVLRLELPAGSHELTLEPVGPGGGPLGAGSPARVEVRDGRNTYVLASFPTGRLAGRVVTGPRP
jgi:hypothetical protein